MIMYPDISNTDTICAVSTPPGVGGIAVIRVSGSRAVEITDTLWLGAALCSVKDHTAHLGSIVEPGGEVLDQAVATVYHEGHSFTGDEVVEIAVHGSRYVQQRLLTLLIDAGARAAEPGEFTRRAFLAGKLDLAEAEAVADVIASSSRASHRLAVSQMTGTFSKSIATLRENLVTLASMLELELDFSEEDVEFASREELRRQARSVAEHVETLAATFATGSVLKDGIPVAIVGEPNVGKSTLLNYLLQDDRAIVSDIPGTTRDTVEDTAVYRDVLYRFIDTAGIRNTSDIVENLGIERAFEKLSQARIVILVTAVGDTEHMDTEELVSLITPRLASGASLIRVMNKSDLMSEEFKHSTAGCINVSAKTGEGISTLLDTIDRLSGVQLIDTADTIVTNARHYAALTAASDALRRLLHGLGDTATGSSSATRTKRLTASASCQPLQPAESTLSDDKWPVETISGDFLAQDLREAIHHLSTITGSITTSDLLTTIFSRFCVGK